MTRNQLEKRYEINGLTDYKLRSTEDLLKVHGIDFREVAGYSSLDDINRAIYKKFIVNIFNAWGLDSRLNLLPKGIYFVEENEYIVKVNPEEKPKNYLRFEYQHGTDSEGNPRNEWLHVIKEGKEWY